MNDNVIFFLCELGIPIVMLIMGILLWRFPPQYNDFIGYRTSMSQKNQLTWDTAQRLFGKIMMIAFVPTMVLTAVVGAVGIIKNFDEDTGAVVCIALTFVQSAVLIGGIIITEVILAKRFDKNGNPKI